MKNQPSTLKISEKMMEMARKYQQEKLSNPLYAKAEETPLQVDRPEIPKIITYSFESEISNNDRINHKEYSPVSDTDNNDPEKFTPPSLHRFRYR